MASVESNWPGKIQERDITSPGAGRTHCRRRDLHLKPEEEVEIDQTTRGRREGRVAGGSRWPGRYPSISGWLKRTKTRGRAGSG